MNFSAGPGPRTLHLAGLPPISPLICYEVIFPGAVVDASDRPGVLVNITNDGWFGTSTGPAQHFASARYRAVEEGLPLLRSANTGISAVVDAYGRVLQRSEMVVEAVIDSPIPVALPATPFARFGLLTVVPLVLLACIPSLLAMGRRSRG
jgi:apolipoprotein N-acyltransferase